LGVVTKILNKWDLFLSQSCTGSKIPVAKFKAPAPRPGRRQQFQVHSTSHTIELILMQLGFCLGVFLLISERCTRVVAKLQGWRVGSQAESASSAMKPTGVADATRPALWQTFKAQHPGCWLNRAAKCTNRCRAAWHIGKRGYVVGIERMASFQGPLVACKPLTALKPHIISSTSF
jgi:hypothetical protein